jgi:hypothetical protein
VGGQHQALVALTRERHNPHRTGGWVGPTADLDVCEKLAQPEFDPRTFQTVVSRYTELATRPTVKYKTQIKSRLCPKI